MTTFPLGRHVHHDVRSLAFRAPASDTHKPVTHRTYGVVLNQGQVGSCVGNAAAAALNTAPLHQRGRTMRESDAVAIYTRATQLDDIAGEYPGQDTGTTALAAAKALQQRGLIQSYSHAFGLDHVLGALQLAPVMLGIAWHQSMFTPDADGFVHPDGNVVGGHETLIRADDAKGSVLVRNSWGRSWGLRGDYRLTYADLGALLADSGDAMVLHP